MLQATIAGLVFSVAFSAVVAPVAFAALGARSRLGGYLFLIAVVTIPEAIVSMMGASLPASVADVLSIPSALGALRTAFAPGTVDLWRAMRAIVALSLVVAIAMFLVRRDAVLVDSPEEQPVIALEGVHARTAGGRGRIASSVANVTLTWEGVLAILGTPADGTTALLELLAGTIPVRAGRAVVGGLPPSEARARVAYVPLETALPDSLRVDEVCALAGELRGEPAMTPGSRLAPLGIEKLVNRRVRSLSPGEARAVSLAIALTSRAPVLLIDEPLAGLDPAAPSRVVTALRARAQDGAAVIVTTASVRDATAVADQLGLLTRGVFTHLPPTLAHVGPTGTRLRVVVAAEAASEVAPFVAALAAETAIVIQTANVRRDARAPRCRRGGGERRRPPRGRSRRRARRDEDERAHRGHRIRCRAARRDSLAHRCAASGHAPLRSLPPMPTSLPAPPAAPLLAPAGSTPPPAGGGA